MKIVYPVEGRCINCHLCEIACIIEHSRTKNPISAYKIENLSFNEEYCRNTPDPAESLEGGRPKPLNRCITDTVEDVSLATTCRHCEEADCILACKNGALYKDESGRVILDEEKCVGCWMCLMACRYGAIKRNPLKRNVPRARFNGINHHCDLCPQRETPACVYICPTGALVFEERK